MQQNSKNIYHEDYESFQSNETNLIFLNLEILRSENLGEGVNRVVCKVTDYTVERITQVIFGKFVGKYPITWQINGRIVSNEFAEFLENIYQNKASETIIPVIDLSQQFQDNAQK